MQKTSHLAFGIEHGIVHIDIQHLSTGFYLFAGNGKGFVVFFLTYKPCKLFGTGNIGTFADIDKIAVGKNQ